MLHPPRDPVRGRLGKVATDAARATTPPRATTARIACLLLAGPGEIDFVVETRNGVVPVQVSWTAPSERHYRALEAFYESFPQALEALRVGPKELEAGALRSQAVHSK
jgi:hypothetical protein